MAKRYRYAFAQQKEAPGGKLSLGLAVASAVLYVMAVLFSAFLGEKGAGLVGGICVFAALLSVYGFIQGLRSFSGGKYAHRFSIVASIANGILMVSWLALYLLGV